MSGPQIQNNSPFFSNGPGSSCANGDSNSRSCGPPIRAGGFSNHHKDEAGNGPNFGGSGSTRSSSFAENDSESDDGERKGPPLPEIGGLVGSIIATPPGVKQPGLVAPTMVQVSQLPAAPTPPAMPTLAPPIPLQSSGLAPLMSTLSTMLLSTTVAFSLSVLPLSTFSASTISSTSAPTSQVATTALKSPTSTLQPTGPTSKDQIDNSAGFSSGLKLGLGLGIPLVVIGVLAVTAVIVALLLFRKRSRSYSPSSLESRSIRRITTIDTPRREQRGNQDLGLVSEIQASYIPDTRPRSSVPTVGSSNIISPYLLNPPQLPLVQQPAIAELPDQFILGGKYRRFSWETDSQHEMLWTLTRTPEIRALSGGGSIFVPPRAVTRGHPEKSTALSGNPI